MGLSYFITGCLALSCALQAVVTYDIYPVNTTLGHPIIYEITAPAPLTIAALQALETQMPDTLECVLDATQNPKIRLQLTPQVLGTIIIPDLVIAGTRLPEQTLTITPTTQPLTPVVPPITQVNRLYFDQPLWLLLGLPVVVLFIRRRHRLIPRQLDRHQAYLLPAHTPLSLAPWLYYTGLVILIIALATPQYTQVYTETSVRGYDAMLLIDTSRKTDDDRIQGIYQALPGLLRKTQFHHVGVIALNSQPHTQVPLTSDYSLVKQAVSRLAYTYDEPDIQTALALAAYRLRYSEHPRIILFTSGSTTTVSLPESVRNYPIDIIGLGSVAGTPLVIENPTYTKRYARDASDTLIQVSRQDDQLKALTTGYYFTAESPSDLEQRLTSLLTLYPPVYATQTTSTVHPDSRGRFLLAGSGLMLLSMAIVISLVYRA